MPPNNFSGPSRGNQDRLAKMQDRFAGVQDRLKDMAATRANMPQRSSRPSPSPTTPAPAPAPASQASGIASAFQGVNPAKAGYDVGNAAIMANQQPSQQFVPTGRSQQAKDFSVLENQAQNRLQQFGITDPQQANMMAQQMRIAQTQDPALRQQYQQNLQQQQLVQQQQAMKQMLQQNPQNAQSFTNDYSRFGLSPEIVSARQAYDQQQQQAIADYQNRFVNASPDQLMSLQNEFSEQMRQRDQQFNQQNPGFRQGIDAYGAQQRQMMGLQPQGAMGLQPQGGLQGQTQASLAAQLAMQAQLANQFGGQGGTGVASDMGGMARFITQYGNQGGMQQAGMGGMGGLGNPANANLALVQPQQFSDPAPQFMQKYGNQGNTGTNMPQMSGAMPYGNPSYAMPITNPQQTRANLPGSGMSSPVSSNPKMFGAA